MMLIVFSPLRSLLRLQHFFYFDMYSFIVHRALVSKRSILGPLIDVANDVTVGELLA